MIFAFSTGLVLFLDKEKMKSVGYYDTELKGGTPECSCKYSLNLIEETYFISGEPVSCQLGRSTYQNRLTY